MNANSYTQEMFLEKASKVEAHSDKNYTFDNFIYTGSNNKSYVTCPRHSDFLISPSNFYKGKGCPRCACGRRSSIPEKVIFFYILNKIHCLDNYTITCHGKSYEIDIFIPQLNLAIEYDGKYAHSRPTSYNKDFIKSSILNQNNITVFRIRDLGLPPINSDKTYNFFITRKDNLENLTEVIRQIYDKINELFELKLVYPLFDIKNDLKEIYDLWHNATKTISLADQNPDLLKFWDYTKNTIDPNTLPWKSKLKAWWLYPCGHSNYQVIRTIVQGVRCGECNRYKPIAVHKYDLIGEFIESYESVYSANKLTRIPSANINKCLSGTRESASGFRWSREKTSKLPPLKYNQRIFNLPPNIEDFRFLEYVKKQGVLISVGDSREIILEVNDIQAKLSYPPTLSRVIRLEKSGFLLKKILNNKEFWELNPNPQYNKTNINNI